MAVALYPLSNIEITKYFNYEPRFDGVFSRNNLLTIKDGAYVINLDYQKSKGTPWVSLFINRNIVVYFDSFGIEYILQEVLNKIEDKSTTHNIFRTEDKDLLICYVWNLLYCFHRTYACCKENQFIFSK